MCDQGFFIGKSLRILTEVHSHPSAIGSWNAFEPLDCPSTFLHEAAWSFISISASLFLPLLSLTYSNMFTLHKFFIITSQHNSFPPSVVSLCDFQLTFLINWKRIDSIHLSFFFLGNNPPVNGQPVGGTACRNPLHLFPVFPVPCKLSFKSKTKLFDNETPIFSWFLFCNYIIFMFSSIFHVVSQFWCLLCSFKSDCTCMLFSIDFSFEHDLCFILCFF